MTMILFSVLIEFEFPIAGLELDRFEHIAYAIDDFVLLFYWIEITKTTESS